MKLKEVQEIHEAGLISEDQLQRIIDHFQLEHPRNRFLKILVMLGGVLVLTGIILVISANWAAIPGWFKIATGIVLMAGAHFAGWKLKNSKLAEVAHFIGAGMFLANIALVGQVYHLSSRTPNAYLLWLVGIIPLVFILRSVAVHILALAGLYIWLGTEMNANDGWLRFASYEVSQMGVYASVGLVLYGLGLAVKRTSYSVLARSTEMVGMCALHLSLWPLLFAGMRDSSATLWLMGPLALLGLALTAWQSRHLPSLTAQWRYSWLAALGGWFLIPALWSYVNFDESYSYIFGHMTPGQGIMSVLLMAGCIVQMRVAEDLKAPWMVNLAIVTMGYCIIVTFGLLIGSMMNTGLIFLVGGAGILGLGFWLEKKRRAVLLRMKA